MDEEKTTVDVEDEKDDTTTEEVEVEETEEETTEEETTEDPYEAELNRLEAERKKAEDIARQKGGALAEAKAKNKQLEDRLTALEKKGGAVDKDELVQQLRAEIKQDAEIDRLTTNPKEQELIRHYIKNNNLSAYDAWVLANKAPLVQARQRETEVDQEELALARISGLSAGGGATDKRDPIAKLASEGLTEAERKNLSL